MLPFQQMVQGLNHDVKVSLRRVWGEAGSTVAIVAILGLGIGPATVAFAVFNHLLFRPPPGLTDSGDVIAVRFRSGSSDGVIADRAAVPHMRGAAAEVGLVRLAAESWTVDLAVRNDNALPVLARVEFTFEEYFSALGVRASVGRLLSDEETESSASDVAVVSETFARRHFGDLLSVVGRSLTVNTAPFVVVGVADRFRGFGGSASRIGQTDVWLSAATSPRVANIRVPATTTALFGRVRAGASLSVMEDRIRTAYKSSASTPTDLRIQTGSEVVPTLSVGLGRYDIHNPAAMKLFWWSMCLTGALLLIAAVNAGGLVISRFSRRRADMIVRLAVGASRYRVTRQNVVETFALGTLGGSFALALAMSLAPWLEGLQLTETFPPLSGMEVDIRVLCFAGLAALFATIVAGLLPSVVAPPRDIRVALVHSGRGKRRQTRLRDVLLVTSVAVSTSLAFAAAVIDSSFRNLLNADVGARLDAVVELVLRPDRLLAKSEYSRPVISDIVARLKTSGVGAVATSAPSPTSGNSRRMSFRVGGDVVDVSQPREYVVSRGIFDLLQIPILMGRDFSEAEAGTGGILQPTPVVLSKALALKLFGAASPLGREFVFERAGARGTEVDAAVVIGVVGDTREDNLRVEPRPTIYHTRPAQVPVTVLVKPNADVALSEIESLVRSVAPELPITTLRPLTDRIAASISQDRSLSFASRVLAVQAILVGGFGVLAMVAQLVSDRTHEFSIRTALGAPRVAILRVAAGKTVMTSFVGVLAGILSYWLASRLVEPGALYAVDAFDLRAGFVAILSVTIITMMGALVPALKATESDPLVALRSE